MVAMGEPASTPNVCTLVALCGVGVVEDLRPEIRERGDGSDDGLVNPVGGVQLPSPPYWKREHSEFGENGAVL